MAYSTAAAIISLSLRPEAVYKIPPNGNFGTALELCKETQTRLKPVPVPGPDDRALADTCSRTANYSTRSVPQP